METTVIAICIDRTNHSQGMRESLALGQCQDLVIFVYFRNFPLGKCSSCRYCQDTSFSAP